VKIQFEESVAGPNFSHKPGKVVDVDDEDDKAIEEAHRFMEKTIASPADDAAAKLHKEWKARRKAVAPSAPAKR
jgi:hypothetical protein